MLNYELVFLGDSYIGYFSHGVNKGLYRPHHASVCMASGATASGLMNPNSFTAASKKFKDYLTDKSKESYLVLQLGEVDCGILIWLKSEKKSISAFEQAEESLNAYMDFIQELRSDGFNNIVITSATLPTINDEDHVGEVISLRRQKVKATFEKRTELTLYFNKRLKTKAEELGVVFIDASKHFIDEQTGFCNTFFRNKVSSDHHMDNNRASVVWAELINDYLRNVQPSKPYFNKLVAKNDTFIKALDMHSKDLSHDLYYQIEKGDRVEFLTLNSYGKTIIASNVIVNSKQIDSRFKFIHSPHFNLDI